MNDSGSYKSIYNQDRYLITYGFGLNNENTDIYIKGCAKRQKNQREQIK